MSDPNPDTVLFRPSKKRKIYRQRAVEEDVTPTPPFSSPPPVHSSPPADLYEDPKDTEGGEVEGVTVSMSEILRLRKLRKHRARGVEFRVEQVGASAQEEEPQELVLRADGDSKEEGLEADGGVKRRFARQTGMVGDVDRHMMAYIDSELAKRLHPATTITKPKAELSPPTFAVELEASPNNPANAKEINRQPATLGKLLEIDLGNEARAKNVLRTEKARRKLDGEEVEDDDDKPTKKKKVRLGRDGKPWRGGRKRRGSEDIKRDKLVEEVLHENRLEIYEEPTPASYKKGEESGSDDADDRIAEAFKREFLDAVSARQRKKVSTTGPTRAKDEEVLKGPKLGGSRSARAAMRDLLLKEQQKK